MKPLTEASFRLPGRTSGEPALLVRRVAGRGPSVIYVHGATFPSALSFNWRFEGRSWAQDFAARGLDAWSFDFAGFGGSDRPAGYARAADAGPPLLRAAEAADQLARVVDHVLAETGQARVSLLSHSWGSQPAGLFSARAPDRIARLALFAPFAERQGDPPPEPPPAWRRMTVAAQLARMTADTPPDHPSVLLDPELAAWGPAYLATCPERREGVKAPGGPLADVQAAWAGALPWDPSEVRAPTLIVRGAWDSLCNDTDAVWLAARLSAVETWDVRIAAAGHMAHLEQGRDRLFAATGAFLTA